MTGSTTSSTSAAITAQPPNTEPPGPKPFRPGLRLPAWPLGHKPSCDRPSCALSRPEPIKLTVPSQPLMSSALGSKKHDQCVVRATGGGGKLLSANCQGIPQCGPSDIGLCVTPERTSPPPQQPAPLTRSRPRVLAASGD